MQLHRRIARALSRVGDSWYLGAAVAIFVAQQLAISIVDVDGAAGVARRTLFFATTILLVGIAVRFRRLWGAWLIAAGIVMNLVPMAAHSGAMPIDYEILARSGAFPEITTADIGSQTEHGKDVVLRREDIHFFALSDRYVVELPGYGVNIYSLGDFVLFAGVGAVVLQALANVIVSGRRQPARTM